MSFLEVAKKNFAMYGASNSDLIKTLRMIKSRVIARELGAQIDTADMQLPVAFNQTIVAQSTAGMHQSTTAEIKSKVIKNPLCEHSGLKYSN